MAEKPETEQAKVDAQPAADQPKVERTKATLSKGTSPEPVENEAPLTFGAEVLVEQAPAFLGCEPHVAAGALHGIDEELSIDSAKRRVTDWLSTPVQTEHDEKE